jgi:hypothetical protein
MTTCNKHVLFYQYMDNPAINQDGSVTPKRFTFAAQHGLRTGEADGVRYMEDVAIISAGEALGHGLMIDDKTLDQVVEAVGKRKLRAYITHNGALWGDRLTKEVGTFSGLSRVDDRVVAKRFTPFKSFAKHRTEEYEALFELADEMPEDWGVSIVPEGYAAWPLKDGNELPFRYGDKKPEGAVSDMPSLRVTSILSADFVDAPAANERGLFRASTTHQSKGDIEMATENTDALALNKQVTDLQAEVVTLKAQIANHATQLAAEQAAFEVELKAERTRVSDVLALGKEHGRDSLALTAITDGSTVDQFRATLLAAYKAGNKPGTPDAADATDINPDRAPKSSAEFLATYRSLSKANPAKASEYMLKHASDFNK